MGSLSAGAWRIRRALGPCVSQQAAGGPCSASGASGRELAGRGGGGRGEKRKEAPGASETKKKGRTWDSGNSGNDDTLVRAFLSVQPVRKVNLSESKKNREG